MRMRRKQRVGMAILASAAMVLAACGDDADSGDDAASEASEAGSEAMSEGSEAMSEGSEAMSEGMSEGSEAAAGGSMDSLVVGTKFDQPLFGLDDLGELTGFDVEIAKQIAADLGVPEDGIEFREAVSANREPFLQNGDVDMVVATYTINDERDEVIDFAGPYYVAGQDIMVESGNPEGIEGIESLNSADITTCTAEGSTSLDNLNEMAPDAEVITFDTYTKCADAMSQGRAQAVTTDNVILVGLVEQSGGDYELIDNPFTEEPYGIGVPEGSELRCQVNEILTAMYEDGRWAEAYEATVGTAGGETPEPPEVDNEGC